MKRPALSELSMTEKISQLLMLRDESIQYKKINGENTIRPKEEIDEILKRCQFGSYWHTGNVKMGIVNLAEEWATGAKMTLEDSKEYIDDIQSNVRLPMLVAMDCEQGLGYSLASGTIVPTPMSVGAANDDELTEELYAGVSRELRAAGSNWRWAPIIDLHGRYSSGILRGFSDDIDKVTKTAKAAIKGAHREHVASTVKHFPGTGGVGRLRDSHFTKGSSIDSSYEDWMERQGKVFQNLIDAGVMTIMTTHAGFPAVDDSTINGMPTPTTLSKKITTGLLREKMGFKGVIITDAILMAGVATLCDTWEDLLIRAINAGNDILLGVNPEDFDTVYNAVMDGRIPMERIDESCERVLDLKEKIGLFDDEIRNEVIDIPAANKMTEEASKKISEKSLTLLYDKNNIIPVCKDKIKDVTIIYASHYNGTGEQLKVMQEEFEKRGATVHLHHRMPKGGIYEACKSDLIIYAGYVAFHRPMGFPSLYGAELATFAQAFTDGREKSIGISLGYPFLHYDVMTGADTFVNMYSPDPEAQIAFVKGVYGEIDFVGISPVDLEPKIRMILG